MNLRFFGHKKIQSSVNSQSERKDPHTKKESEDNFDFIKKSEVLLE